MRPFFLHRVGGDAHIAPRPYGRERSVETYCSVDEPNGPMWASAPTRRRGFFLNSQHIHKLFRLFSGCLYIILLLICKIQEESPNGEFRKSPEAEKDRSTGHCGGCPGAGGAAGGSIAGAQKCAQACHRSEQLHGKVGPGDHRLHPGGGVRLRHPDQRGCGGPVRSRHRQGGEALRRAGGHGGGGHNACRREPQHSPQLPLLRPGQPGLPGQEHPQGGVQHRQLLRKGGSHRPGENRLCRTGGQGGGRDV